MGNSCHGSRASSSSPGGAKPGGLGRQLCHAVLLGWDVWRPGAADFSGKTGVNPL